MIKSLRILMLIGVLLCTISCGKESSSKTYKSATIQYLGNPVVDGCGWKILIEKVTYSPKDLPAVYQINGLDVQVIYHLTNKKASCGFNVNAFDEIILDEIKSK
jgi:hypothetical protein